jgi:hypothetical protein
MSAEATNWVWKHSEAAGSDRLVLLALADFCNEKAECYASYGTLVKKTRLSPATIYRSLKSLRDMGEIVQLAQGALGNGGEDASEWHLPKCQNEVTFNLNASCLQSELSTIHNNTDIKGATPTASPKSPKKQSNSLPSSVFNPEGVPLPHGARFAHVWGEFCQHRKEIKAKLTPTAVGKILGDLGAVSEADAYDALAKSIRNGWRGVFLSEKQGSPVASGKIVSLPPSRGQSAFDRELEEIRRAAGE